MSNLLKRFLTAGLAGGVAVTALILSAWGMWMFAVIVSMLGLYEFYKITNITSKMGKVVLLSFGGLVWVYVAFFILQTISSQEMLLTVVIEANWFILFTAIMGFAAILMLFEKKVKEPVREMSGLIFGFIYAFLPILLLFLVALDHSAIADNMDMFKMEANRSASYDFRIPLGILLLSWTVDTFAYFGGRFLGKHKLFERISPKKTWEGAISGTISCIALGFALNTIWPKPFNWIVVGIIIAVVAQLGDLVESMFKRGLKIKDSGGILPGHGGMLDRFDGLYLALPLIYLYSLFVTILNF